MWETAPSEVPYFRERSNFPRIWFRYLRFRTWGLEIKKLKAHNSLWQGCFFFHYYLATSTTNWSQISRGLHMLWYSWWEDWSLTITEISVHSVSKANLWCWPSTNDVWLVIDWYHYHTIQFNTRLYTFTISYIWDPLSKSILFCCHQGMFKSSHNPFLKEVGFFIV